MLRSRPLALAAGALAGLAALLAPTAANAAPTASGGYVALGDSYSSGLGASAGYLDTTCYRSASAYPYLYAQATAPSSFSFQACSGATTTDVQANQLGALGPDTATVSITVGGNDVGFSTVVRDCLLGSDSTCQGSVATAEQQGRTVLPGKLDTLYTAIRAAAPNAHVVVLGYPELFAPDATGCLDLDAVKRAAVNKGSDVLNQVVQAEVAKYPGFTYADVDARFAGHRICDGSAWFNGPGFTRGWYHPNAGGQAGAYLPALTANA
ncbi:SGNH/GDSL hydrolase family protein [Kitasatospora sp. NPDC005856]|uniref:SGNH/GDSL hydrolase family protein n=1 Tax=Kitasatospora sp. NPDC005856 TaxID=3154566 RepID=UPI0033FBD0EE